MVAGDEEIGKDSAGTITVSKCITCLKTMIGKNLLHQVEFGLKFDII